MRPLPPTFAAALAGGATTLARCWTLRRRDGLVLGFTDHDRDLVLGGVVHAAGTGLEAADTTSELGFAVGGGEVAGALVAPGLAEADLSAGRWDAATVETWLVDWQDPAQRVLLDTGSLGEVRRAGPAFAAELRGIAHRLDQPQGRVFQPLCAADLGDARCRVDLAAPAWSATAAVSATDGRLFIRADTLAGRADGLFTGGRLVFAGGGNAGLAMEVQQHRATDSAGEITLWERMPQPIAPGNAFSITAGCDHRMTTCAGRFANVANFRGFPHMPGNDFALRFITDGEPGMDGGSFHR